MNRILHQNKEKINKLQNFINSNHEGKPVSRAIIILLSYFMEAKKIQKIIGIALSTIYYRVKPRKNQKVYAFGCLEKQNNKLIYGVFKRKRAKEFIVFLRHVLTVYEGKKIYMILDNSSMHKAKILMNFIEKNKICLELLFLLTYNPANNPIERVWGTVKGWINCNYLYPDKDSLVIGVISGLRRYQQESRLAYAA